LTLLSYLISKQHTKILICDCEEGIFAVSLNYAERGNASHRVVYDVCCFFETWRIRTSIYVL